MVRKRKRGKGKGKRRRIEFSLGTGGNMKFSGLKRVCGRLSRAGKKLSSIT